MKYLVLAWNPDAIAPDMLHGAWKVVWWGTNLRDARRELKKADGPTVKLVRVETLDDINYR